MFKFINLSVKAVIIILISGLLLIFSAFFIFPLDCQIIKNYQTINLQYQVEYIQKMENLLQNTL